MTDCEVCLRPTVDIVTVAFTSNTVCVVAFCRDCTTAVFQLMADRYNQAIDEQNETVRELVRWFGIDGNNPKVDDPAESEASNE
jgi:hypothetical protein